VNEHETSAHICAVSDPNMVLCAAGRVGVVYFITCDRPDFPVKIGFAIDLKARLLGIQPALPYRVITLATIKGTHRLEKRIHHEFKAFRLNGEWFERVPPIMDAIERVKRKERAFKDVKRLEERHLAAIRAEFDHASV
jgi:hypothetical protein